MEAQSLSALLRTNSYPGRGIVMGRSRDGREAVAIYFIMGRSDNSRNRVFAPTEDGIRTRAYDPDRMKDPSLVIYHPVRKAGTFLVVANGTQTDAIRDALRTPAPPENPAEAFRRFRAALDDQTFEPDAPHYTPRISALLSPDGAFALSILKSMEGNPACCCRFFFHYDHLPAGEGRFLHTYATDGDPLPSFTGEPVRITLDADGPEETAARIWDALNHDNRISLFVRYIRLGSGEARDMIINRQH